MPRTRVSAHFCLDEFAQHARHGFDVESYPAEWIASRLQPLCEVLEALHYELGEKSVTITSGYRSPAYNRKVGGARNSQHVLGRAADIRVKGASPKRVHDTLLKMHREGRIRIGGLGRYRAFTHVDIRPGRLRRWNPQKLP